MLQTILWIVGLACAVWVVYDVWTRLKAKQGEKILWTVAAIIPALNIITAIVYYLVKKK